MPPLNPDFREFLRLLNSEKTEYLLIGGYAVALYGYERPTADLDVWVACDPVNADRLVKVLQEFGFASRSLSRELFLRPDAITRMGVPPNRIEILTGISGVDFADCNKRRRVEDLWGVAVPVIDIEDLRRNKKASGRHKDLADVEALADEKSEARARRKQRGPRRSR